MATHRYAIAAAAAVTAAVIAGGTPVAADPPDGWTNRRVLTCEIDGTTTKIETYLPPSGFGAPFHLVGDTAVLVPKTVHVTLPSGETFTTYYRPGFDHNAVDTVHCWYTDPSGLFVDITGMLTGGS